PAAQNSPLPRRIAKQRAVSWEELLGDHFQWGVRGIYCFAVTHRSRRGAITKWCARKISATVSGKPVVQYRPFRDNAGGVDVLVDNVIVVFDLLEVYGVTKARGLE